MCAFVLLDPVSCGHHSRSWRSLEPELAKIYPFMSLAFPQRRSEMGPLVSEALRGGHTEIVAVGYGALDETVNGFFNPEGSLSPDAVLAVLALNNESVVHLSKAAVRPIDIGRVSYLSNDGKARIRYFASMAGFGDLTQLAPPRPRPVLKRLFGDSEPAVRLIVDQTFDDIVTIQSVGISNGQSFAAHGQSTSRGNSGGGEFDVVVRRGGRNEPVIQLRGCKVVAAPVEQTRGRLVPVALDGQAVGRLPATFEILPRALNVRC